MRHRFVWLLLFSALSGLGACGGDAIGDLLDPSKDDSEEEGFRRGVGGGSVIKDIFEGARFQREAPSIVNISPASGSGEVSIRSIVIITFSESMDIELVNQESVTFREAGGSGTALLVDQIWTQSQTVLVLAPQSNLQEETGYEVTISGSLEDLQGQSLDTDAETTVSFTTGIDNSEVRFEIAAISPRDGSEFNYRGSPIIAYLTEPAVLDGGSEALNSPNNFIVRVDGQLANGAFEDTAGGRVLQFVPDQLYPASAEVVVTISGKVVSQINRRLNRGTDFRLDFKTFPAESPTDILFPGNRSVGGPQPSDGFVSSANLRSFDAEVSVEDGRADQISIVFVDVEGSNGLLFQKSFASSVPFTVDLQPEESVAALQDGDVFVGAFGTSRGINGAVELVKVLVKDTEGFNVAALGPPNAGSGLETTLVTPLAEPILQGQLDQPGAELTITGSGLTATALINLANPLEFDGQTTFSERGTGDEFLTDAFITSPIEGVTGLTFDPVFFSNFEGSDAFGNDDSQPFAGGFLQAGIIGGTTTQADPAGGLVVEAIGEDTFTLLNGTDVIVETYPRDTTGTGQIILEVPNANFTGSELAGLGDRITVTLLRNGYHVMTLQGLPNPGVSGEPYGVRVIMEPANRTIKIPISVDSEAQDIQVVAGCNVADFDDRDAIVSRQRQPRSLNEVSLRPNRLKAFSLIGTRGTGNNPERFLLTALPVFSDMVGEVTFDLDSAAAFRNGQSLAITPTWPTNVADTLQLVDSGMPVLDISEVRVEARLPGFDGLLALGISKVDVTDGTGTVRLPQSFITNSQPSSINLQGDDTAMELVIQPNLAGGDSREGVSPDALRDSFVVSLALRDEVTERVSLVRSEVDFSALASPIVVIDPLDPPVVPAPIPGSVDFDLNHPPVVVFSDTLSDESLYCFSLIRSGALVDPSNPGLGTFNRRWDVYTIGGLREVNEVAAFFPDIEAADPGNSTSDFDSNGNYSLDLQGFDLNNASIGGSTEEFSFGVFAQSDLLRSTWKYVRYPIVLLPTF